ncbi:hypothetical protein M0R45_017757 [Rubus argutus]|uniref:HMA domain-containing protein n=1 Tax=Rubus argutus TaxID=59490 RepID=A0AAW1XYX6_RUBAR
MVQQKIVMKVPMSCEKHRTRALKIAAVAKGVSKVAIEAEKGQVEVIGEGVDSMCLTMSLRKKLGHADIVSVEEVKEKKEEKKPADEPVWISGYNIVRYPQYPMHCQVVYDEPSNCSVM